MTTSKQKLISDIKEILKTQYDIKTLKEVISASSSSAVKDLVKKNPNIDLKTLRTSLGKAGHGGVKQIIQTDLDAVKKELGIKAPPAPGAAPNNQKPATQPMPTTPKPSNAADDQIEQPEVEKAKKLANFLKILPATYLAELNKNIASLGIQGVQDVTSAEKFIEDYDSIFFSLEDYKGIIHLLGALNDKTKYPSPVKTPQGKPGTSQPTPAR